MKINSRYLFPKIEPITPIQYKYLKDEHRFIVVSAGRRARKTLIAKKKLLLSALSIPNSKFIHAAPTHSQAKQIFWTGLKLYTKYLRVYKSDTELSITLRNNSIIQVTGLDKPERLEGQSDIPIRGIHITEFGNTKPNLWSNNIRPILADTKGWAILDGVPEGINHYYDIALHAAGGVIPETKPIEGAYSDNKQWAFYTWFSSDVLEQEELETIKAETDEKTYQQEYEGAFTSMEGLAYYNFSELNIGKVERNPNLPIAIGMDFNVDPMCSVEGHLYPDRFEQFGESILRNSNTEEMCQHLRKKYNLRRNSSAQLEAVVFPDATGGARKTSATISDLQILKKYGFKVRALKNNPYQIDRINTVNSAIKTQRGKTKLIIDPRCKATISDMEQVRRLPDGRLNKKQEQEGKPRVHITDALGYLIYYNFPLRNKSSFYR